jgi:eukaryotic-like serine/threonine-protein kinase
MSNVGDRDRAGSRVPALDDRSTERDIASRGSLTEFRGPMPPSVSPHTIVRQPALVEVSASAGTHSSLLAGTLVHQFEVIRELGRGGMGTVYLARDTKLARLVALKFLGVVGGDLSQRFVVEARATASCSHENIVIIYQVDEWDGAPYMALEYLEGKTFEDALAHDELSVARIVEIMIAVTRALIRAHDLGVVHCDLKPANILLTPQGNVKVLDFGIARLMKGANNDGRQSLSALQKELSRGLDIVLGDSGVSGTMRYMSFEQWGLGDIDGRTDLWALGIILWEALTGLHPLGQVSNATVMQSIVEIDKPLPSLASVAPHLPEALVALVDQCLVKSSAGRIASALDVLRALEQQSFLRNGSALVADEAPFVGMAAFQENNAEIFFGRDREIAAATMRLTAQPLLVLAGQSGIGKSSFVRAGLVPALKQNGAWQVAIARPGHNPVSELVTAVLGMLDNTSGHDLQHSVADLVKQTSAEPGVLGALLRAHARALSRRLLIFIDQFEETFTLGEVVERKVYLAALAGIADDASSPLRVVLSIRSDFLDRISEHAKFLDQLNNGLMFLQPLGAAGLRDALQRPIAARGFTFEKPIVDEMISSLNRTTGALPLLQFCASQLWEHRTVEQRTLTYRSYVELGKIEGALAKYAEGLVLGLPPAAQKLLRAMLVRLVTTDGTRTVVDRDDLEQLGEQRQARALIDRLVDARLLSIEVQDDSARVELIHESLISHWPSLKRWREESGDDAAFLHDLRPMAKQWQAKGRPPGLLWSGASLVEARAFLQRHDGVLAGYENDYLTAAFAADNRSKRRRRTLITTMFGLLLCIIAAAVVALVIIAEQKKLSSQQAERAQREATRATSAEAAATDQFHKLQAEQKARTLADEQRSQAQAAAVAAAEKTTVARSEATTAQAEVTKSQAALEVQNAALAKAIREEKIARKNAEDAAKAAQVSNAALAKLTAEQRRKIEELEKKGKPLIKVIE